MPLVIVCGVPCSGKTRRSLEICEILTRNGHEVHMINDASCGIEYADYGDFGAEKEARGKIRSELNKFIGKTSVTIVDSANYIKGFRYEMWCVARATSTACVTVVPVGNYAECRERNRKEQNRLSDIQFDELVQRWEEPDKNRKWESPLFPLLDDEQIDEENLLKSLKGVRPQDSLSRATSNPPLKGTDFLQQVDQEVKAIMKRIVERQKENGGGGGEMVFNGTTVFLVNQMRCYEINET